MNQLSIDKIQHERFGASLKLENETYRIIVPLVYGIRIMHLSLKEGENVFFEDTEGSIRQEGPEFHALGSDGWLLRGGHRLWASPEAYPRTYAPDDKPIEYVLTESGVKFISPVEPWTHISKEIELIFTDEEITVRHVITNKGPWPIELAPWALSVMAPGGTAVVPHATRETGLLPNRSIALWPYAKMNDERVTWGEESIAVRQSSEFQQAFKFGMHNEEGWAAYIRNGVAFEKRYEPQQDVQYPDFGSSFELYTNAHMLELETLGPLVTIQPEQTASHTEYWRLTACQDAEHYLRLRSAAR
ncbi:hypothetical protein [Paenibacillus apiarius]|uniref:Uncharacterized protein n=1 Tax=Paenibacillus apiarius TaxID=46240 RepID=A0ABT4DXL0_9BACL|nr:hypothetical protein [Paenibacillus apiarius]MCY9512865.1 hypothetical protein [Paenibacillus apiarius]MCY9522086.1 hypothetical protein [Paenibacillus apiarius]MCY9554095.1 hypothetical protein [Paenibacillus apiarius]MCY9558846.1 hypothetical protein [Paenibacillus apiarius]MCY9683893.1 hypothetical protein [Paenibacillus apiarius]